VTATVPGTAQAAGTALAAGSARAAAVARFEAALGPAADPGNPAGRAAVLAADAAGHCAPGAIAAVRRAGLGAELVPTALGGRFADIPTLAAVLRSLYRRDPALGLGRALAGTMASISVWTAGSEAQRRRVAEVLLAGDTIACAYHELAHGSDLRGNELLARADGDGWRLHGGKEVVSNLAEAPLAVVFAHTPAAGHGGHSLFLLDRAAADPATIEDLARYPSVGMRGLSLGGVRFDGTRLDRQALIGAEGQGADLALRAFQLTRLLVPAATIGLLDTMLREAHGALSRRTLYGSPATALGPVRSGLADALADLLIGDAFAGVAMRALHVDPGPASGYAAAVKAYVPRVLMSATDSLARLLGSQFFLTAGNPMVGKLQRDARPSSFGHASRTACLLTLVGQLRTVARRGWNAGTAEPFPAAVFDPAATFGPPELAAWRSTGDGRDPLLAGLRRDAATRQPTRQRELAAAEADAAAEFTGLIGAVAELRPHECSAAASTAALDAAARWAALAARAAVLGLWQHGGPGTGGVPLAGLLHRLDVHAGRARGPMPEPAQAALLALLGERVEQARTLDWDAVPTDA